MTTWVLVANRNSARILGRQEGCLEEVERLSNRPSDESTTARQQTAASTFALRIAAYLERARQRSAFDRLVLVGEPGFLELLRMWLSKPVRALVVTSSATDPVVSPEFAPLAGAISASAA